MSSGFLDLAYLIEISIVFNLAYREIKPLFDKRKIQDDIQQITERKEIQKTIKYCQENSNRLSEGEVSKSYIKLITSADSLSKELTKKYKVWLINTNMLIVLSILLFATIYKHIPTIEYITMNFEIIWWVLFIILVSSISAPIFLTYSSNKKINTIYKNAEGNSKEFLNTHSKYLKEQAENQKW